MNYAVLSKLGVDVWTSRLVEHNSYSLKLINAVYRAPCFVLLPVDDMDKRHFELYHKMLAVLDLEPQAIMQVALLQQADIDSKKLSAAILAWQPRHIAVFSDSIKLQVTIPIANIAHPRCLMGDVEAKKSAYQQLLQIKAKINDMRH